MSPPDAVRLRPSANPPATVGSAQNADEKAKAASASQARPQESKGEWSFDSLIEDTNKSLKEMFDAVANALDFSVTCETRAAMKAQAPTSQSRAFAPPMNGDTRTWVEESTELSPQHESSQTANKQARVEPDATKEKMRAGVASRNEAGPTRARLTGDLSKLTGDLKKEVKPTPTDKPTPKPEVAPYRDRMPAKQRAAQNQARGIHEAYDREAQQKKLRQQEAEKAREAALKAEHMKRINSSSARFKYDAGQAVKGLVSDVLHGRHSGRRGPTY